MSKETTFCIIKPDSFRNNDVGRILTQIEEKGFEICAMEKINLDRSFCKTFYTEHKERPFFSSLLDFMTSGPVVVLALKRENACLYLREIMGSTDPKKAAPNTIRALYGTEIEKNAIHGSDSLKNAKRELALFFPEALF